MATNVTIRNISDERIRTRTGQPGRALDAGQEAEVDLDDPRVIAALDQWPGRYIVVASSGGGGITLHRSGILNFADAQEPNPESEVVYFEDALVDGAVLIKAWAVFDFNLNWTGSGAPVLQLVFSPTDGQGVVDPGNGIDLITYDLNDGWPNGADITGTVMTEFGRKYTIDTGDPNATIRDFSKQEKLAGAVVVGQAGVEAVHSPHAPDVVRTAGTYEVLALIG